MKITNAQVRSNEHQVMALFHQGKNFSAIAEVMGFWTTDKETGEKVPNRSVPYNIFRRVCQRETIENLEEIRAGDLSRINALLQALWPTIANPPHEWDMEAMSPRELEVRTTHFYKAVAEARALLAQKAKLQGLDAPQKIEAKVETVTREDFEKDLSAYLAGAHAAYEEYKASKETPSA